ncbi:MAG: DUF4404 family protein [Anaerolineales bacterium]|jgi:hypothetical protein
MNDQELCQLLEQIQNEIKGTQSVDAKERELLHDLEGDIRELLERCDAEQIQAPPLTTRRLEDAIEYMAINHPTLTAMLSNISTILGNAGV